MNKTAIGGRRALPIIPHKVDENTSISQRAVDGYINATALCKACDKQLNDYTRLKQTQEFLEELSSVTGITVTGNHITGLIQIKQGGIPSLQGTWVHPQVAINLAQWASPKFAVLVSKWVFDWLNGTMKQQYSFPYHLRRYLINSKKIPHTHFSMLNQITIKLIGDLEIEGYVMPNELMPDISMGKIFSTWLKDNGYEPDSFDTYTHVFDDGKRYPVQARLYPNHLITEVNKQIDIWIQEKAWGYFEKRDTTALPYLKETLRLIEQEKKELE